MLYRKWTVFKTQKIVVKHRVVINNCAVWGAELKLFLKIWNTGYCGFVCEKNCRIVNKCWHLRVVSVWRKHIERYRQRQKRTEQHTHTQSQRERERERERERGSTHRRFRLLKSMKVSSRMQLMRLAFNNLQSIQNTRTDITSLCVIFCPLLCVQKYETQFHRKVNNPSAVMISIHFRVISIIFRAASKFAK